jgi:hypothetical protein
MTRCPVTRSKIQATILAAERLAAMRALADAEARRCTRDINRARKLVRTLTTHLLATGEA